METIAERIKFLRKSVLHVSQEELAIAIAAHTGRTLSRGAVGNWETGGGIERVFEDALCDLSGCSLEWLARGVGLPPPARLKPKRKPLLLEHRIPGFSEDVESSVDYLSGRPKRDTILEIDVRLGTGGGGVPIEKWVHDGNGNSYSAEGVKGEWKLPEEIMREQLRATTATIRIFEVIGDSMEPLLFNGDRAFVDTRWTSPTPPGIFAVWDGNGLVMKRVQLIHGSDPPRVKLISANTAYDPYEVLLSEMKLIGRLAGKFTTIITKNSP